MNLVLTMAGRYQRFADQGFKMPKYLLPWGDKTILSIILSELNKDELFTEIVLVANLRDESYMPHVKSLMKVNGINLSNLIMTEDTGGQVESAMIGVGALERIVGPDSQAVVFHNIDTILLNRNMKHVFESLQSKSGYLDVFVSNDKNYSYVLLDDKRNVSEVAEKIVVSDLASSGLYGFKNTEIFKKYASAKDVYTSSVFKRMIASKLEVAAGPRFSDLETIVLGSPAEYMNASLTLL